MKSIKEKIRQHLANVTEATAKKIGAAIGMKDYPSDVVKALSEMRTDAEVECEKRKGQGNEYWYWLTNVTSGACVQKSGENETQASLTAADETQMPTDNACCNAAKVVATTASQEVSELRNRISELELDATRMLEYLDEKNQRIESLEEEIGQRNREIKKLTSDLGHARIQIDALNEQLMAGEEAVDVKDAARGYLVCSPKRKPAKLMKAESAVARAKSAAKATGRGEVFALVPVGVATRKQIRAVEFKERAA